MIRRRYESRRAAPNVGATMCDTLPHCVTPRREGLEPPPVGLEILHQLTLDFHLTPLRAMSYEKRLALPTMHALQNALHFPRTTASFR